MNVYRLGRQKRVFVLALLKSYRMKAAVKLIRNLH